MAFLRVSCYQFPTLYQGRTLPSLYSIFIPPVKGIRLISGGVGRLLCQHSRVAEKVILASPLEYPLPLLHKVMAFSFLFIEFSCSVTWGYKFDFFSCFVRIRSSVWVGGNGFWACVPSPVKISSSYPASSPYSFSLITTLHLLWNSSCPRSRDFLSFCLPIPPDPAVFVEVVSSSPEESADCLRIPFISL